nr:MAG: hypothetical protein EDM05_01235 [Leptolyngbya sp. IPPAS B-1204]
MNPLLELTTGRVRMSILAGAHDWRLLYRLKILDPSFDFAGRNTKGFHSLFKTDFINTELIGVDRC